MGSTELIEWGRKLIEVGRKTYGQDGFGVLAGEVNVENQGVLVAETCHQIRICSKRRTLTDKRSGVCVGRCE